MPEQSMIRLRRKIICSGAMVGLKAYVFHLIQVCSWCKYVRLLSDAAMFWLWRSFVRFGYMAHSPTNARKYGNYRGSEGLLWQVC